MHDFIGTHQLVEKWVEVFDYLGGARFRGFVSSNDEGKRAMFVFFDRSVTGCDLKPG